MSRRGIQIKAMLTLGILVGFGAVSTLAAWTGTATATSTISAGTVSLGIGGAAENATAATYSVPIAGTDWYPGLSRAAVVVVKNTGSLTVPYSIAGSVAETGTGTLGQGLEISVRINSGLNGTAPNKTCTTTVPEDVVYSKPAKVPFAGASEPRTLASGSSETLCVQYTLPKTASNELQGNATSVELAFTATAGS